MNTNKRTMAVMALVLIFPAALFMLALLARQLQPLQYGAQQIVMWYAYRGWTLWILLLGLPLIVLIMGCITLLQNWNAVIERSQLATLTIATTTFVAGMALAVVTLHMLMN
jgi:hypothetical protein